MQNDMWTAVIWSKSKPEVTFQYGGRLGEFNGMPSQSHASHCGVLPFGEFNAMISQPHATLQGKRILSAILLKIAIFYFFCFLNAVLALASGGFRIVFDTLVCTQPTAQGCYVAECFRLLHVLVEGPQGCLLLAGFSCDL